MIVVKIAWHLEYTDTKKNKCSGIDVAQEKFSKTQQLWYRQCITE